MNPETIKFLQKEAKHAFKSLSLFDKRKIGTWKKLYLEIKKSWKQGNKIELPEDWREQLKERKTNHA